MRPELSLSLSLSLSLTLTLTRCCSRPAYRMTALVCYLVITPTRYCSRRAYLTTRRRLTAKSRSRWCAPLQPYEALCSPTQAAALRRLLPYATLCNQVRNNKGTTKLLKQWAARGRQCCQLKGGRMECELMKAAVKPKKGL